LKVFNFIQAHGFDYGGCLGTAGIGIEIQTAFEICNVTDE